MLYCSLLSNLRVLALRRRVWFKLSLEEKSIQTKETQPIDGII